MMNFLSLVLKESWAIVWESSLFDFHGIASGWEKAGWNELKLKEDEEIRLKLI